MERDNMMHGARTALNTIPEMREWAEAIERKNSVEMPELSDEELKTLEIPQTEICMPERPRPLLLITNGGLRREASFLPIRRHSDSKKGR